MRTTLAALLLMPALAHASPVATPAGGTWILAHGIVHVGDGTRLEDASVVVRDGLIERVETGEVQLEAATVIDCRGKHVTPGLIAADSTIGLIEIGAVRATRDTAELGRLNPHLRSWAAFNPDSELLGVAMANGVLAAVVEPEGELVKGQGAVMLLSGWTREDMALRAPCALAIDWPSLAVDRSPKAVPPLAEQEAAIARALDDVKDLFASAAAHRAEDATRPADVVEDVRLRALVPVLDHDIPVVVRADSVAQIRSALKWAKDEGVRMVLLGARDGWRVADEIAAARVPVVIGSVRALPARDHEAYDTCFENPVKLWRAGVRIMFTVGDPSNLRNLPDEAAFAMPWGLPPEEALRAITSTPAEIFGVADRIGSIAPRKMANLVIWDGPPLEITSDVERIFVRGQEIPLEDRHSRLWRKYRDRPAQ
jgi:imidazolonepropionase-like amidohydrolase